MPETHDHIVKGLRPMKESDCAKVRDILNKYLEKYEVKQVWSKKEISHFFVPQSNVIYSYVIENEQKQITDFFSFYSLPSSVLDHPKYKTLSAAYSYYFVNNTYSITELFETCCIIARNEGFDVFNSLDVMEYRECFDKLMFSPGDGFLHYYFYNWTLKNTCIYPKQIGLVLV